MLTINEYVEKYRLPEMKLLGETKYFKYYERANKQEGIDIGPPIIVEESKTKHTFKICDREQAANVIKLFYGGK